MGLKDRRKGDGSVGRCGGPQVICTRRQSGDIGAERELSLAYAYPPNFERLACWAPPMLIPGR